MGILLLDWLTFLLRWLHIVAAIAWVGASFYFIWVENRLLRGGEQRSDAVAGHLWAIHGGGFYYLEKQQTAPVPLPPQLHWFKWEAYTTWLSGVALLTVLYYLNPSLWLLAGDSGYSATVAVVCGIGYLLFGVVLYIAFAQTPLLRYPRCFGALGLLLVTLAAWGLLQVLTPRAVFLHTGAMLATIMAVNVLMVIMPVQRRLVATAERGEVANQADREGSVRAGLRSLHNNYLALPVVFLMISLHTPLLATGARAPFVMAVLILFAVSIRHVINIKNKGQPFAYRFIIAAVICLLVAMALTLPPNAFLSNAASDKVTLQQVQALTEKHCVSCHAAAPVDAIFRVAPVGFKVETEAEIIAAKDKIYQRVVIDRSMPFNNQSNMQEEERQLIARWFAQQE